MEDDAIGLAREALELQPYTSEWPRSYMPDRVYPSRIFLPKGPETRRTHYVSLIEADSDEWRVRLRFRDALRSDPALREQYEQLKRRLLVECPGDRPAYTAARSPLLTTASRLLLQEPDKCAGLR